MKAAVNVYFRSNKVIIAPCAGGGGITYEIEPVFVEEASMNYKKIGDRVMTALKVSCDNICSMNLNIPDLTKYKSPVLKKLNIKSNSVFFRNTQACQIFIDDDWCYILEPWVRDEKHKGFDPVDDDRLLLIGGGEDVSGPEVGRALIHHFLPA